MPYFTLGHRLPQPLSAVLFGDRLKYGLTPRTDDPHWREWESLYTLFYETNQKQSVGKRVNDAGYQVVQRVDVTGKRVLEVGPGDLTHIGWWNGVPEHVSLADISQEMLDKSRHRLMSAGVPCSVHRVVRTASRLPFADETFDVLFSFYCLEHLHPIDTYLKDMARVLKPGGLLVGAIPAEGGLAWGSGRFLTTRRWLKRNSTVNPDKIICWEHPNFAAQVLAALDTRFRQVYLSFWPLRVPSIDLNLVVRFVYSK